jgi:hypothetical protein
MFNVVYTQTNTGKKRPKALDGSITVTNDSIILKSDAGMYVKKFNKPLNQGEISSGDELNISGYEILVENNMDDTAGTAPVIVPDMKRLKPSTVLVPLSRATSSQVMQSHSRAGSTTGACMSIKTTALSSGVSSATYTCHGSSTTSHQGSGNENNITEQAASMDLVPVKGSSTTTTFTSFKTNQKISSITKASTSPAHKRLIRIPNTILNKLRKHQITAVYFLISSMNGHSGTKGMLGPDKAPECFAITSTSQTSHIHIHSDSNSNSNSYNSDNGSGSDSDDPFETTMKSRTQSKSGAGTSTGSTGSGGSGAILADEMGLGKTFTSLAVIATLSAFHSQTLQSHSKCTSTSTSTSTNLCKNNKNSNSFRAIIVAPASLIEHWNKELGRVLGPTVIPFTIQSSNDKGKLHPNAGTANKLIVILITYDMTRILAKEM